MTVSRREFLKASSLFALQTGTGDSGVVVNDIHSQLNPTRVREVVAVSSVSTRLTCGSGIGTRGQHRRRQACDGRSAVC